MGYVGLAGIAAAVILPVAFFVLGKEERSASGVTWLLHAAAPNTPPRRDRGEWTLAAALRSREFLFVTAGFACLNSPIQLVLTHHVAHLVEVGHSKLLVAGIVGLLGFVSISAKILWGYLADRVWPEWIYLAGCSCVVAGIVALLGIGPTSSRWDLYLYAVLMGVGYAVSPSMTPIMSGLFFGGPHFGVIFGALNTLYHAGGAAGVWLAGYAHDLTGNYRLPFLASIASTASTVVLVWLAAPRRQKPARAAAGRWRQKTNSGDSEIRPV